LVKGKKNCISKSKTLEPQKDLTLRKDIHSLKKHGTRTFRICLSCAGVNFEHCTKPKSKSRKKTFNKIMNKIFNRYHCNQNRVFISK
jgi:hypothetical protein